ncbi:MAG: M23 family peptidase [Alphaproteobacteria bacterium]|nr:M23 family peptidase [Alphaproteobacteria bacterium]
MKKFLNLVEKIIEHRLFRPVSISIVVSFVLFNAATHFLTLLADYREEREQRIRRTPIKINLAELESKFEFAEEQVAQHRVKKGDTMSGILDGIGAGEQDISLILAEIKKVFPLSKLTVGDEMVVKYRVKIGFDTSKSLEGKDISRKVVVSSVTILPSAEERIVAVRDNAGAYSAKKILVKLTRHVAKFSGVIKNSLFEDGVASGISPNSMMNMINLYGYDVDFQRDIHDGDRFEMLVESFYDESGKRVKDGNVLFSSLVLQSRPIEIYQFKNGDRIEYFDAKGNSVRKSLLRTPINGARISSGFGLRRHPVLGYSKMHKGTDFAAPIGTPILAAGSGTVVYMGVKGGYGNYVQIRHNSEYATAYGHASRFNKKFRVGSKVKQGDVVAYVGSTGRSTGPHLHFEVIYRGTQVNPSKVKATSGVKLAGKDLKRFEAVKSEIDGYRKNIPNSVNANR